MLRKKRTWIVIIVVLVLLGGAYGIYAITNADTATADEEAPLQTATAREGNITISATAAGTIIPATEVQLSFSSGGVLADLLVNIGDSVMAGEVLARLDSSDAQQALANVRLQLAQAAMKTDGSATETGVSFDEITIEQARINLEQAQQALDDLLNWQPDEDQIAQADANLAAAKAGYNAAVGQESSSYYNIEIAQINLQQAEEDLASAQENYDEVYDEARDWEEFYNEPTCMQGQSGSDKNPCTGITWSARLANDRNSAANALARAQDSLRLAQIEYDRTVSGSASSSSANAQSSVLNAELALKTAQSGPDDETIKAAELAVRQAELALQQAQLNRENNALSLAQAQLNLDAAEKALSETELIAPMDGTVMAINASVGESAGSAVIVLADLEQPLLEVYLDETDLNMVGLGYEVEVVFDALPDDVYNGQVVQIDPQLTNSNGVTAVRALVQLNANSFAKPQKLPVGLNATAEVIGGRAENAVLVPVEALRELSAGKYAVFVMENGEPVLRLVEVGLMDYSFAEITSGLQAGETVSTGIVQTN